MHDTNSDSRTTTAMFGGMAFLMLQIVIPAAVANLVEALTITGYLPEISLFEVPLYGWAVAACALWAIVVLNCGPFLTLGRRERGRKE